MSDPDQCEIVERRVRLVVTQLARRFHARCRQMGIDEMDVVRRLGVSQPQVARWIHSERLTVNALRRLSEALEVDEDWWTGPIPCQVDVRDPRPAHVIAARVGEILGNQKK